MTDRPEMLKSTLIGGVIFGVWAAIPILGFVNCLCCALVIGAGFVASYLYSKECRKAGVEFRPGNGAFVGLIAGLFYSISTTIVSIPVKALMPEMDMGEAMDQLRQADVPPEALEFIESFVQGSAGMMGIIIGFFLTLLIAAIFSTIGGLIGAAVFKVEPPTVSTGDVPPPPAV
jgi:hypothetical protein